MDSKLLFVIGFLCMAALAMARPNEFNDYEERQIEKTGDKLNDETETAEEETSNDESKMVMEDMNTETSTALVQNDEHDPESIKDKGYCGNQIYNPNTQICCCGIVHAKKSYYTCCGYNYYDARYSQCCDYYSVKAKKAKCPRHKI